MTNDSNDSVNDLITRYLVGEATPGEERELMAWVNRNDDNRRHFNTLKKALGLADQHFAATFSEGLPIDLDSEWDQFRENVGATAKAPRLPTSLIWLRIAATLLLVAVTGAVLYYITGRERVMYQTASSMETVTLPDGSTVTLNRFTSLSYNPDFANENRTVHLNGEAYFDVVPDAANPFIVTTEKASVKVLGTSFNVNAYDSLEEVEVIVETGVVSLQSNQSRQKVELAAGERGIYSSAKERVSRTVNNDLNFLSWNTQRIVFVESDLRTVLRTLERTYGAEIIINTEVPPSCIVTVTFDHQTLSSVLKVLESTLNLKYTINGNRVEVTEAGC